MKLSKAGLTLLLLSLSFQVFAQRGKNPHYYLDLDLYETYERHFGLGFRIPTGIPLKYGRHAIGIEQKKTLLDYQEIKDRFIYNDFYSTSFSWNFFKPRDKDHVPWISSLNYTFHGHKWFENKDTTLEFRFMTGHKSGTSSWTYGVFLQDQGALRGIPMPFLIYTTMFGKHRLSAGIPFIGLNGPIAGKFDYLFSLSPGGVKTGSKLKTSKHSTWSLTWFYGVDSYRLESPEFNDEQSLLLEKHDLEFKYLSSHFWKFKIYGAAGYEFDRQFFRGENIFDTDDDKYRIENSTYLKVGANFSWN